MKPSFVFTLLLIFIILISSSHVSSRFSGNKQGEEVVELSQITDLEDIELMNKLMGMEACDAGDDGCLKRRIISEAHLDYIYTQHHKP
ncbi:PHYTOSULFOKINE 3 PRECURSOR [Hibiscus trionum]|uniref:Phytosulfokine n=1 Tax=Hibiscus trionum TaxID=183268 RepID=A0A9W7I2S8_HIBTR|nr:PHYTOSULFOKINE 3 PRECURSOR [Hibiscus trionum]